MEGSGNVQIKNEARSSHFKYTRKQLNFGEDKELGIEVSCINHGKVFMESFLII